MERIIGAGSAIGDRLALRPLATGDDEALFAALTPEVWRLAPSAFGRSREEFDAYLSTARKNVAEGTSEAFAVLLDGVPVGMTRLHLINLIDRSAEIGYTWYREDLWGAGVNPFCKLRMLRRAFEELELIRVFFCVDARNERSQRAVAALGAVREGVHRQDRLLPDGSFRDTVFFSILREEWPEVRARLEARISGP